MEQTKTAKKIYLPNEIWFKIFHYVKVKDTLQLSLVSLPSKMQIFLILVVLCAFTTPVLKNQPTVDQRTFYKNVQIRFSKLDPILAWQVCHDFMNLVKNNSLWRHYCRRASNTLKLNEINMFPSCKDLYRDILQPFAWALGHTFKLPGYKDRVVQWIIADCSITFQSLFFNICLIITHDRVHHISLQGRVKSVK